MSAPATDLDLFGDEALADPYPFYAAPRETGPAVHFVHAPVRIRSH